MFKLARGEWAVQQEHFKISTVTETRKMVEIQNFKNLYTISEKKSNGRSNISQTVRVTEILEKPKMFRMPFYFQWTER